MGRVVLEKSHCIQVVVKFLDTMTQSMTSSVRVCVHETSIGLHSISRVVAKIATGACVHMICRVKGQILAGLKKFQVITSLLYSLTELVRLETQHT